jgi:hypothetical protein
MHVSQAKTIRTKGMPRCSPLYQRVWIASRVVLVPLAQKQKKPRSPVRPRHDRFLAAAAFSFARLGLARRPWRASAQFRGSGL